ncbi:hypothetical protein [Zunongwangia endophytica]|uniref:Uncharacterized protein n=1 Tax=Zunongwangia endophytica TaxID=1808945 RepID=A0ABV8HAI9_9FLAO|nr:hypothetical protein [Zunongwangia endophytica]MDN3595295.1 hypothetical protein [Zunongwangia endophytica]
MKQLLKLVKENSRKTGNFSGISEVRLAQAASISLPRTRELLKVLSSNQKILLTEGINSKIVFAI